MAALAELEFVLVAKAAIVHTGAESSAAEGAHSEVFYWWSP